MHFAKSEDAFAFSNCKRRRFQSVWVAAIDAIIAERQAQSSSAGHRDLLDLLLSLKDAGTGETLSNAEIRDLTFRMSNRQFSRNYSLWYFYESTVRSSQSWGF
jgi:cytochrome P450